MRHRYLSHRFSFILSFILFFLTSPLQALVQSDDNLDSSYVYLSEDLSNIAALIFKISEFDPDHDSLLHQLKRNIANGFIVGDALVVKKALEHANLIVQQNFDYLNPEYAQDIIKELKEVINQINSDSLDIDVDTTNRARLKTLLIRKHLEVLGKSLFHKHVRTKHGIHVEGHLEVDKSSQFHSNVIIDGTLSVTDLVVASCVDNLCIDNLSVADALITSNATIGGTLSVTDLVVASCIDNLCVNNLSVTDTLVASDVIINGTLSVADLMVTSCVDNLCINNLSVTDAFITNASIENLTVQSSIADSTIVNLTVTGTLSAADGIITDLTVLNCMTNLCVNTLSVTNETIDLLSATDAIIDNEKVTLLSANDAVIANLTVTNCINNLCVNNISITDAIITGSTTISSLSTAGIVHNSAAGLLSSSLIVNADVSPSAAIVDTKLATISTASKVANSATTATSTNTPNTIVLRDATGNFSAGAISVTDEVMSGNLTITPFNTAGIVHNSAAGLLSSSLIVNADVSPSAAIVDTKLATISTAGKVANSATTATSANTPNTIVLRDATGNFSAGALSVTDEVMSGNLTITPFNTAGIVHNSAAGLLSSSLIVNADVSPSAAIVDTKLATISTAGKVANSATTATSADVPNTIVLRNGSGNFTTNMITIDGIVTNPTDVATKQYVDSAIGGTGTNLNTPNTLVLRDGTGSFAAQVVSVVDSVISRNLVLSTNPSSLTAGNIMKGANRFIHNFGTNNTFVGINSGNFTMTGTDNVGIGVNTLNANTTGPNNIAIGTNSLNANTIGISNVGIGINALMDNTTGIRNIAIGSGALFNNTIGERNTAIGDSALFDNIVGIRNTAVGEACLIDCIGNENTAIGASALEDVVSGSNNVGIGVGAGASLTTGSNNIYIKSAATAASEADTIRLGSTQTRCFVSGVFGIVTGGGAIPVLIDSLGQLGTVASSRDVKHDIQDMTDLSEKIMDLRPVTFAYNSDPNEITQYGLIAEEVEEILPDLVIKNTTGKVETVKYHILPIFILNEMKKQHTTIRELKSQLSECIKRINMLEDRS